MQSRDETGDEMMRKWVVGPNSRLEVEDWLASYRPDTYRIEDAPDESGIEVKISDDQIANAFSVAFSSVEDDVVEIPAAPPG